MLQKHEDKALSALTPAQRRAYDAVTASLALTPDEANEVGKLVALAAERASRRPWYDRLVRLGQPTEAETKTIAAAEAAYESKRAVVKAAERAGREAEDAYRNAVAATYARASEGRVGQPASQERDEARDLAALEVKVHDLVTARDIAAADSLGAEHALARARVAADVAGAARQRRFRAEGYR